MKSFKYQERATENLFVARETAKKGILSLFPFSFKVYHGVNYTS